MVGSFTIPPSNLPTRTPVPHQHTSARNADLHDPRTCCFQGGSTRPASLMEFSPRSPCSSTSQASTGPLLPSYLTRALTSFPACSGYNVGFLLCADELLLRVAPYYPGFSHSQSNSRRLAAKWAASVAKKPILDPCLPYASPH